MITPPPPPRRLRGFVLGRLALATLATLVAPPSMAQPPAGIPTTTSRAKAQVQVHEGAVTIHAQEVELTHLLQEIARQSGLEVTVYGTLSARPAVHFDHLPMREAMATLLRGQRFALRYQPPSLAAKGSPTVTNHLWIFPKEDGEATLLSGQQPKTLPQPSPTTLAELTRLLDQAEEEDGLEGALDGVITAALEAEDKAVRAEAVRGLGEFDHPEVLPVLEQALLDPAAQVREAAIEALSNVGGTDAAWALATALDDPSADLRQEAIYALTELDEEVARTLLQRSLGDEQASVREAAIEALEDLGDLDGEDEDGDEQEDDEELEL